MSSIQIQKTIGLNLIFNQVLKLHLFVLFVNDELQLE